MTPKFLGEIKDGKIALKDKATYLDYIRTLKGEVSVTVKRVTNRNKRSLNQLAYYWAVPLKLIAEHTGHNQSEIHEILKYKFLKEHFEITNAEGKRVECLVVKSTGSLSTVQFEQYMTSIRQWASVELNIFVPDPTGVDYSTEGN